MEVLPLLDIIPCRPVNGCLLGVPATDQTYQAVVWGDSHAAHLARMLDEVGQGVGTTLREITKVGCPPLLGVRFLPIDPDRVDCPAWNDRVLQTILADPRALPGQRRDPLRSRTTR